MTTDGWLMRSLRLIRPNATRDYSSMLGINVLNQPVWCAHMMQDVRKVWFGSVTGLMFGPNTDDQNGSWLFCGLPDVRLEVHVTQHVVSTCDSTRAHSCWCLMILLLWFRHCFMASIHIHPFGSCILSRLVWCLQFNGAFPVLLGSIVGSW